MSEQCRWVALGQKQENKESLDPWYTWQYNIVKAGFMAVNGAYTYEAFS